MVKLEPSSFRDRAGYVYRDAGVLYRHVGEGYRRPWTELENSGFITELQDSGRLVRHEKIADPSAVAILRPEEVPFISYPYEWCFSQLKDAALLTLGLQKDAVQRGFTLKDASAYNIQFLRGKPILIDTLSFDIYEEGKPWIAYRQFCRHFLAPLALMARVHPEFGRTLSAHIDGIPLDLASSALPGRTHLQAGLAMHIHLHAKSEGQGGKSATKTARVGKTGLLGLIDSLERTIAGLDWKPAGTIWADYYDDTNYSESAMTQKGELVRSLLGKVQPTAKVLWDLGANTGQFSRIAAETADLVIAWDVDAGAVERHYRKVRQEGHENVLPLMQDLTQPSPGIGWANEERPGFSDRSNADTVLALALIHHLAIGNNVPLSRTAKFLARLSPFAIIEFVPKSDSQVQRLLSSREDIFDDYHEEGFESSFGKQYTTVDKKRISGSERTLYLLRRKDSV